MNEISQASLANAEGLVPQAVADYERPLVNYAYSLLKDVEKARDVVQETFVKLCQQEPGHVRESLKAWLVTVCRNGALDVLRKDRRMITIDSTTMENVGCESPTPAQSASRKDSHGQALALLERLPDNQREVIRLRFQSDLSYREISEITQLSESNVGFLLHKGLKQLRALMSA
ncbi:MAG: RNA polymerase sigma factor (sigma-70 family) [Verrucomicrobiales bacterium]|jgi:RNA polymerase sigma factor (sigma-70 family)